MVRGRVQEKYNLLITFEKYAKTPVNKLFLKNLT